MSQAIDRPGATSEWVAAITSRIAFQPHSWIPELNTDISAMVIHADGGSARVAARQYTKPMVRAGAKDVVGEARVVDRVPASLDERGNLFL